MVTLTDIDIIQLLRKNNLNADTLEETVVERLANNNLHAATLGRRILRAETAPLAALSIIMYQTDNF